MTAVRIPRLLAAARAALAAILDGLERYDEAEPLYREAIAAFEREPIDPLVLAALTLHNLAARDRSGDAARAAAEAAEAMAVLQATLEPGHPRLVACAGTAWGGAA